MKQLTIILGLIMILSSCKNESNNLINYTVSQITKDSIPLLKVKASFKVGSNGETILLYQDKAWGQDSLHNVIHNIRVLSKNGKIIQNRDSGWYKINHPKGLHKIDIEYIIQQDSKGNLTTWDTYRPVIQSNYFHLFSHNFFMLPKHIVRDSNFNVDIKWEAFPKTYNIANSFDSKRYSQKIKNISEEEFHSAVFVGGDFRIHDIDIKGNKLIFATRGDWKVLSDSIMVNILKKTVISQRDFWQDHSQKYFAVTMIPTFMERGSSFQGSGLTNSFATNATNNKYLEIEGLVYLFNHELQHNWTGHVIKNEEEEKQYWFSEGFTDYYTIKNIARGKIYGLDKSHFIKEFNKYVKSLFTNPVKEIPNNDMTYENFWSGKEGMQKLPYHRGAIFAFYLDHKIKQASNNEKSLDNVLLDFKNDALSNNQKITHSYFIATVNKYLKDDIKPFFDNHIEQGKLYDLEFIYKSFGFEYLPTSKIFDLGFTFSDDKKSILVVNENSQAYKAGIRVGDLVKSRSYYYNSIEHEAEFTLIRNGKEIKIKYLPTKEAQIPQLLDSKKNREVLSF